MDTAEGAKDVNDIYGVIGVAYRFFSASTFRHNKLVYAQKKKQRKVPQLSNIRWDCYYLAVNLYKSRYGCLVEALKEAVKNINDKTLE